MSTLRVNTLQNTSTTDGGISIDTSGHVTVDGVAMPAAGPLSNRNLIINGAMQVAQRATQVTSATTEGYRTCDRWLFSISALGTWTVDQATDAPEGFTNSFKVTCTTADSSPAAADKLQIIQFIEAQNLQHLKYGTSNAENLTISFWVKSNKTGNASFQLTQSDNSSKQFTASYTINSADTWEYKTITIPGDPSGLIDNDNGIGLETCWWLNSGSDFTGGTHNSAWESQTDPNRNATNLGVGGATSDNFAITGVQLELGDVVTSFEHRIYSDELAKCKRYYEENPTTQSLYRAYPGGSSVAVAYSYIWNVEKRTVPTVTIGDKSPSSFAETVDTHGVYYFRSGSVTAYKVEGPITADAEL